MGSESRFKALFLGDVVGLPGRRAVSLELSKLIEQRQPDLVVVNAENAADDGLGLLPEHFFELRELGADVVTTGNHVWEKSEAWELLKSEPRLLRPANYPAHLPGQGVVAFKLEKGPWKDREVAVLNLQGRYRMSPIDDPLQIATALVAELRERTSLIFVDFHAEESSEKEAFPWALNGLVSVVVGTHTHVATRDARILSGGTATQTDLGMCGPSASVIGSRPDISIEKSLSQLPLKNSILDTEGEINGLWVELDPDTGRALALETIHLSVKTVC